MVWIFCDIFCLFFFNFVAYCPHFYKKYLIYKIICNFVSLAQLSS